MYDSSSPDSHHTSSYKRSDKKLICYNSLEADIGLHCNTVCVDMVHEWRLSNCIALHCIGLSVALYCIAFHCIELFVALHCIATGYIGLQQDTLTCLLHCIAWQQDTLHWMSVALYCIAFHCIELFVALHCIATGYIGLQQDTLTCLLHCIAWQQDTLHWIVCCIALHSITLNCLLHCIALQQIGPLIVRRILILSEYADYCLSMQRVHGMCVSDADLWKCAEREYAEYA